LPDAAYYLRQSYLERGRALNRIGAWSIDAATATLTLWNATPEQTLFRILDGDTLRLLDRNGEDIGSALNYNLSRATSFEPAALALPLRGMYSNRADIGSFTECESGRRFVVAQEGDSGALESAYVAARRQPNDALLVSFDGRITMRPPVDGAGMQPTAIVNSFTGVWPAETCGARMSLSELRGTNWVATRIANEPVELAADMREARLILAADGSSVSGFSGCNNFAGTATINGGAIRFGSTAANLRACIGPAADLESRLFAALASAARFELQRHHLDIYDDSGTLTARFEARALE
jgi:heat shock protein HslJ